MRRCSWTRRARFDCASANPFSSPALIDLWLWQVANRYSSTTTPESIAKDIEALLAK